MSIEIINISKKFNSHLALDKVSFTVEEGELISLLGPSGSGKTTLLRILAGLEVPDSGEVLFSKQNITSIPVMERNIGFVFQHYALFRHMTVEENIGFSLKVKGIPKKERSKRISELLELIQLSSLAKRYPAQLSGGQKQRVALARALASRPRVLLLDEPFGALDANVRKDLRRWLRNLHKEIKVTSIMVTHDQEEAFEVSDRVVILNHGKLEQIGKPDEVFHHPASPFVMKFLGNVNIFHGRIESGQAKLSLESPSSTQLYIRPHDWEISLYKEEDFIESTIEYINAASSVVKIDLKTTNHQDLQVDIPYEKYKDMNLKKGMRVYLKPKEVKVFVEDYVI